MTARPPDASHPGLVIDRVSARTRDGWTLDLKRTSSPAHRVAASRPVIIVPGYGMNAFIFGFHPKGRSMERSLAEAGFEVWSANLRGQGASRPDSAATPGPSLKAYALDDLRAVVDTVLGATTGPRDAVSLIGCSLGGSVSYAYLAAEADPRVHSVVAVGSPLRWTTLHPALRLAFASPALVGAIPFSGSRRMAKVGLGVLTRFPELLSIYMNATHVDLTRAEVLAETVEDPVPRVNRDIARWMSARDMILGGINVTSGLARVERPLLVVVSNRDGIVPEDAALSVLNAWGGHDVEVMRVGDAEDWYAHADLFIAHESERKVFAPIAAWLHARA